MKVECPHANNPEMVTKSLQGWNIYKDQCVRCFHQPTNPEGLFICMKCFNGFCPIDRDQHVQDHKHSLYFHYARVLKNNQEKVQITKLAIGVEGGASIGPEYSDQYKIYCVECNAFDFENASIFEPQLKSLINTESVFKKQLAVAWEEEQAAPCQHTLTLQQNPLVFQHTKCGKCDLSTGLWLCLTCGNNGCARKNWDGSGGNDHGVKHHEQTSHPVVIKLGTITAEGTASGYCYKCNKDITDDALAAHLQVLGININTQKKTEKTMAEMNIDLNLNFSLSRLVEGGKDKAIPMYGPSYTGMQNIGSSCYLNSILQALNSLPEYVEQYYTKGEQHRKTCKRIPSNCFYCQVSKISWGLHSGKYSQKLTKTQIINGIEQIEEYQQAIKPYHFKVLIAGNNADFRSSQQQDALEYLQWYFDRLQKQKHDCIPKLFGFQTNTVMTCLGCNGYKLIGESNNQFKFPINPPTQHDIDEFYASLENEDKEVKQSKLAEDPHYNFDFDQSLSMLRAGDSREILCPRCGTNTEFIARNYFKSTPKYLMMIPNRFYIEGASYKKLNAIIKMPEDLDISEFLFVNSPPKGELMAEEKKKKYDENSVGMIVEMGQTRNAAIRALMANGGNPQAALNWIFENMDRPDLNDPLPQEEDDQPQAVDPNAISQVMEMGFDENQAKIALIKNKSEIASAIQWLFNCGGDVSPFLSLLKPSKPKQQINESGPLCSKYRLKAVIIHLGKTVHHGHYVVYVKKQGKWVLFNDDKVTIPKEPVLGKGYIYLYETA